ncbi:DUF6074 family protein [Rhizobium rhizogenes]|uniref:DUF6074 family protein n=1 Tax=Rhizobium rhizogenes TaxID=359 RepID=UPI0015728F46|nr:DUF6074 family protein [Rhizobium rhizogenes]NTG09242.1 hypothetical protein [Rhizobium rhizogenes]
MTECKLIPFPLSARVGKVRRVAEVCERRSDKDRASYWRTETGRLWDHLEAIGCSEPEIIRQMDGFKAAVQSEINRRYCQDIGGQGGNNPKGAA